LGSLSAPERGAGGGRSKMPEGATCVAEGVGVHCFIPLKSHQ